MAYLSERRKYQRCSHTICKAFMSNNGKQWSEIELKDISGGGLSFNSVKHFDMGMSLAFNITVYNMLSEFNLKLDGQIIRAEDINGKSTYSVKFDGMNKYSQIQLDELIKSKISFYNAKEQMSDDGIYTFLFLPRVRPPSFRSKLRILK